MPAQIERQSDPDAAAVTYAYVQSVAHGTVLMPKDAMDDPSTPIRLFPEDTNPYVADTQLWTHNASRQLVNKGTGLVMEARGNAPGAPVTQEPHRTPVPASQKWRFNKATGQFHSDVEDPTSKRRDLVLGAPYARGEIILQRAATSVPQQQWRMVKNVLPAPYQFFLEDPVSGNLLTPVGGKLTQSTPLGMEAQNVDYQQTQLWSWLGSGQLVNITAAMAANVTGADPRGKIILYPGQNNAEPLSTPANQTWSYTPEGRIQSDLGDYFLTHQGSQVSLVKGASSSSGQQWRVRRAVYPEPVSLAQAVKLDGSGQALFLQDAGPQLDDFTAEAWVQTRSGGPVITSRNASTATTALALVVQGDGSVVFRTTGGSASLTDWRTASITTGPTNATDGQWHHLAAVRQDTALMVYLDGVAVPPVSTVTSGRDFGNPPLQQIYFGTILADTGIPTPTYLAGSLAEIRLWNRARTDIEIPAGMHHQIDDHDPDLLGRWAFTDTTDTTVRDSSLAHRDATLAGAPALFESVVEIVPQGDFYLVTQALLLQDYVHTDTTSAPDEIEGYRVTINVRDFNDQGTPGFLTLKLNNPAVDEKAVLHFSDATEITLKGDDQTTLTTDAQGVLSFTLDAGGSLVCPVLRVQADFQTDGSWMVIAPDRQAHAAAAAISGNNLRGLDANGQVIPGKEGQAPLPHADASTADATASAINQMMSAATQPNTQADQQQIRLLTDLAPTPTIRPYLPRYQLAGITATGHDPVTDAIATHHVDRDAPVARILNPSNADHAHWGFDFTTFTPHTPEEAAEQIRGRVVTATDADGGYSKAVLEKLTPDVILGKELLSLTESEYEEVAKENILATTSGAESWLTRHVRNAERLLVNTVKTVIKDANGLPKEVEHLVVTAIDDAGEAVYGVIQAVEHAVDVVAGILEKLGSDIKKLVAFLKELFNWQDIVDTQRVFFTYLNNLEDFVGKVLSDSLSLASGELRNLKSEVDRAIGNWRSDLIEDGAQKRVSSTNAAPPQSLKSNYATTLTSASMNRGLKDPGFSMSARSVDSLDPTTLIQIAAKADTRLIAAIGSSWDGVLEQVLHSPVGTVHDVKSFLLDGVEILLSALEALLDAMINQIADVIDIFRDMVLETVHALFQLGQQEIHIPLVTPFYEHVVMRDNPDPAGRKLSIFGLGALVAAMPAVFAYKLTHDGHAPYTREEATAFVHLDPDQYTWLRNPFRSSPPMNRSGEGTVNPVPPQVLSMISQGIGLFFSFFNDVLFVIEAQPKLKEQLVESGGFGLSSQLKYHFGSSKDWAKLISGMSLLGSFIGVCAGAVFISMAIDGEPAPLALTTIGVATGVVTLFTAVVATFNGGDKEKRAKIDTWANVFSGLVSIGLKSASFGVADKSTAQKEQNAVFSLVGGLCGAAGQIFGISRQYILDAEGEVRFVVGVLIFGVCDVVGNMVPFACSAGVLANVLDPSEKTATKALVS